MFSSVEAKIAALPEKWNSGYRRWGLGWGERQIVSSVAEQAGDTVLGFCSTVG